MIIAIDGPAGTGKTTVAKKLASLISFKYFDTGLMYRALTFAALQKNVNCDSNDLVLQLLDANLIEFRTENNEVKIFFGNDDITDKLTSKEVTGLVSKISAYEDVRQHMVLQQRHIAKDDNFITVGRDIGTVVFPDAKLKIFLTASPEVRAERRYNEIIEKKLTTTIPTKEEILNDITRRDFLDSSRTSSPLKPAKDAIIIDTSHLSIDQVVEKILKLVP